MTMCFIVPISYEFLPFLFSTHASHRDLHSFPTRRSSDLPFAWRSHGGDGTPCPVTAQRAARRASICVHRGSSARRAAPAGDRKSTRLNSSHGYISYAVFCLKKKNFNLFLDECITSIVYAL